MTYNVVKVARAPLMVCLQCPLCCNLVHEATTISECLHTFCRDCIYQRLGDGESDCCPICNVSLGCSPLEKLRADHQLDDVCAKIFPLRSRKRTAIDSGTDVPAPPPARRKERSLSSLGIGAAPPSANPGFVNRKTKSLPRRSVTIRDTSADEIEDGNRASEKFREFEAGNGLSETEYSAGALLEGDFLDGKAIPVSDEKLVNLISVKREICVEGKRAANKEEHLQGKRKERFPSVKRTPLPKKVLEELPPGSVSLTHGNDSLSNLGMYLAERSKISSTGLLCSQAADVSEHANALPCKEEAECGYKLKPQVSILERRQRLGKNSRNLSTLAHLAEVAVDHAGQVGSSQQHIGHYRAGAHAARSHRERGKRRSVKGAGLGESFIFHAADESIGASSQLYSWMPPLHRTSAGLDKLPVVRNKSTSANGGTATKAVPATKHDRRQVGLWFSLQAAENQIGENALPQISTRYLRIKDGKLPVSIVKKYLAKKLDLKSEAEVEITCRGQPVVPSLPLESIQGIWFATALAPDLLPSQKKEENSGSNNGKNCSLACGSSAKEYMMVLTYGRNHRNLISQ
eukprot:c27506_g1_i1 orf=212-1933(+)